MLLYRWTAHLTYHLQHPSSVEDGLLQESVLGPVLFFICINDLSDCSGKPSLLFTDVSKYCRTASTLITLTGRKAMAITLY